MRAVVEGGFRRSRSKVVFVRLRVKGEVKGLTV